MANPFDLADGSYSVLVNAEGQHCLWPKFIAVPDGWSVVYGPAGRSDCLAYVNEHWTHMRPLSA